MESIYTEWLILRQFQYDDIDDDTLTNWIADPLVQGRCGELVFETGDSVKALIDKWNTELFRWATILKDGSENIGQIGFFRYYPEEKMAEIEYCAGQSFGETDTYRKLSRPLSILYL